MRQITRAGIAGLLAGVLATTAVPGQAQDLVSSVNSVTRSYNYVEIQYLPEIEADLPILAIAVIDLNDNWSLRAEYTKLDAGEEDLFELEASSSSLGVLYHKPLAAISNSDWVAGLMIGKVDIEIDSPIFEQTLEGSSNFQEGYLGIRRTLMPALEGEVGLTAYRSEDENGENDITFEGDLKVVYRVLTSLDVALSLSEIGISDGNLFGFGLRYTWH